MLQLILHGIIISVISFLWGTPIYLFAYKSKIATNFWFHSFVSRITFLYFSGIITLSFVSSVICLFAPLNFQILLSLSAGLFFILLITKKIEIGILLKSITFQSFSKLQLIFVTVTILLFLFLGCLQPVNADTHIYHIQIIRWFNEYGTVPGIANLYPRFGLGSNWFNLISFFHLPFLEKQNFTFLNTTTAIWFFLWLFNQWKFHSIRREENVSHKILSLLYLLIIIHSLYDWEIFRDAVNSTNYDFIVIALTMISITFLVEKILLPIENDRFFFPFILFAISIIPFKFSGIFALLLLPFYLFSLNKAKYWIISLITGIIILAPLLIKNYFITGYPLYPLSFSVLSPDWKVPEDITNFLRQYILVTNRLYNHNIRVNDIPDLYKEHWISIWFSGILIRHKILLGLAFVSLLLFFLKTKTRINYKKLRILFVLLFIMAAGWFFTAPSPRFGFGVLAILAFFPISFYFGKYISNSIQRVVLTMILLVIGYYLITKISNSLLFPEHIFRPTSMYKPPSQLIKLNKIDLHLPKIINSHWQAECHDIELPCIYQINPFLEPRGNFLKNGFRIKTIPDSNFIRNYKY